MKEKRTIRSVSQCPSHMVLLSRKVHATLDKTMSTIVINGLDHRTNIQTVENFCQKYGRILNCYIKSNECIVTFAERHNAEEFIRASPHRIGSVGLVSATWQITMHRNSSQNQQSSKTSNSSCRLIARGTHEQLVEKDLIHYFSQFGQVRMCLPNALQGYAIITFDDRISSERALKQSKHFLNGRSLIVEPYTNSSESESNKRMKLSNSNESISTLSMAQLQREKEQLIDEKLQLERQCQERFQLYELEKLQLNEYIVKQQYEFTQQIAQYQCLLKQSVDQINERDKQIEQLKKENKDIDDLLRQSVHDYEQQNIQMKKREAVHNQAKRKYEELYKAYMKLKDTFASQRGTEEHSNEVAVISIEEPHMHTAKSHATPDNVRKK